MEQFVEFTATDIVRWMYQNYPSFNFYDEREKGEKVLLIFEAPKDQDIRDAVNDQLLDMSIEHYFRGNNLIIVAPEDEEYEIEGSTSVKCATEEMPYLVEFSFDSGDEESGPRVHNYSEVVYALSEEDACNRFRESLGPNDAGFCGCTARLATEEEVMEDEEDRRRQEEWDSWMEDNSELVIRGSQEFFDKGDGQTYWYYTKHGVGPGSVPRGLNIIKVQSDKYGDYFLTDRVLTTDSLRYYDIQEKSPNGSVMSSEDIMTERLWEIAERYNSSYPVSGDWDTETEHEQRAIANELGVSLREAKQLMIDELGFTPDMFRGVNNSMKIKASTGYDEGISKLCELYSNLMNCQSQIGELEDYYFGDKKMVPDLTRCYNGVDRAMKAIAKYCEDNYL